MAALWLAGTLGATGVVFTAVGKLSTNLSSIGDNESRAWLGPGSSDSTTTSLAPFIATTSSSMVAVDPTTIETVVETTSSSVDDRSVEDPSLSSDTQPSTTRPTAVRTTPVVTATVPVVVTTAPVPPTAAPPTAAPSTSPTVATTEAPPTTSPVGGCVTSRRSLTGRNTVVYQVCPAGLIFVQALPAPGWSVGSSVVTGPPTVTVIFSKGSTLITCTLRPLGDALVDTSSC